MGQNKLKKKIKAAKVFAKMSEGLTNQEIADELGIGRNTVSRILNGDETKKILDQADSDMTAMVQKIMHRAQDIIDRGQDADAIKLMLPFLKTKGIVKDAVEHHHKFPAPMKVTYPGEPTVVLGTERDFEDEEGNGTEDTEASED